MVNDNEFDATNDDHQAEVDALGELLLGFSLERDQNETLDAYREAVGDMIVWMSDKGYDVEYFDHLKETGNMAAALAHALVGADLIQTATDGTATMQMVRERAAEPKDGSEGEPEAKGKIIWS